MDDINSWFIIRSPFNLPRLTLIPAGISNHIRIKVLDEITHPFPNFIGCNIEAREWISDSISEL